MTDNVPKFQPSIFFCARNETIGLLNSDADGGLENVVGGVKQAWLRVACVAEGQLAPDGDGKTAQTVPPSLL